MTPVRPGARKHFMHRYIHGLHHTIEDIVGMQDPQTLDDAMRMALTAGSIATAPFTPTHTAALVAAGRRSEPATLDVHRVQG